MAINSDGGFLPRNTRSPRNAGFLRLRLPDFLTMRDTYAGTAAALRDALRHSVERGGTSALSVLHQGVPTAATLTGTDATTQAGRIRRRLDRLAPVPRALLVVAYAPRDVACNCRAPCCSGRYPNPEWRAALELVVAHTAPILAGHVLNVRLRSALVANLLTRTHETAVSLAQRCGVHRNTVAEHTAILDAALMGTRHASGEFDAAFARIDTLMREAGTLLLMGIATFAVGFVLTYATIGIWGAIALTVLRFIQGVGVGGEWGGSVLMSMEWARTNAHRGFVASWPQFGVPAGLFLANLAVLAMSEISGSSFVTWGWRVPFFLSIVLVAIGLYIRLDILETPVFARPLAERRIEKAPTLEVLRRQPKDILLSAFVRMAEQAPFYLYTAFIFTYGVTTLGVSRDLLLAAVLAAAVVEFGTIPLFGHLSDRIGRRKMYMIGAAAVGIFGFLYFTMVDTKNPVLIFAAIVLSLVPHAMVYGPQAALIAESFTGRLRYSGASLGYQPASVIAGGPAPLIATALFAYYHSGYAIAGYILVCAVFSLVSAWWMVDYTNKDISREYDDTHAMGDGGHARPAA